MLFFSIFVFGHGGLEVLEKFILIWAVFRKYWQAKPNSGIILDRIQPDSNFLPDGLNN
jgi:hypothetical protein